MDKIITEKRKTLAQILQTARIQKGISQTALAELVNVNPKTIMRIENCNYSPNLDILYKLIVALEIKLTLNNQLI